jgi:hypothetical protein
VSATLEGTGRVGDDLFLLAHSDVTGRPCVAPRALGLGLAGGLLAELELAGAVVLERGTLAVDSRVRPGDKLAARVLGVLAAEREVHPVREWLLFLGRTAAGDVAARLQAAGYLVPARRWRQRGGERWLPVDADSALGPVLRTRAAVEASRTPFVEDVVLAALADACGLAPRVAQYAAPAPGRPLSEVVAWLDPSLRELAAQTKAAVDSALLAGRVSAR